MSAYAHYQALRVEVKNEIKELNQKLKFLKNVKKSLEKVPSLRNQTAEKVYSDEFLNEYQALQDEIFHQSVVFKLKYDKSYTIQSILNSRDRIAEVRENKDKYRTNDLACYYQIN